MQVLKNILFGLMHGFILMGSIAAVELIGIFWLAKPVGVRSPAGRIGAGWVIPATLLDVIGIYAVRGTWPGRTGSR